MCFERMKELSFSLLALKVNGRFYNIRRDSMIIHNPPISAKSFLFCVVCIPLASAYPCNNLCTESRIYIETIFLATFSNCGTSAHSGILFQIFLANIQTVRCTEEKSLLNQQNWSVTGYHSQTLLIKYNT